MISLKLADAISVIGICLSVPYPSLYSFMHDGTSTPGDTAPIIMPNENQSIIGIE